MATNPFDFGAGQAQGNERKDVPFLPGTVVTRRWFEIGPDLTVRSPFRGNIFSGETTGYYEGECNVGPMERAMLQFQQFLVAMNGSHTNVVIPPLKDSLEDRENHVVGQSDCTCGFYTYYGYPKHEDLIPDGGRYIGGLVESFGRITYGDKGLRCQKMRILALVLRTKITPFPEYLKDWYRSYGWRLSLFVHLVMLLGMLIIDTLIRGIVGAITGSGMETNVWAVAWVVFFSQALPVLSIAKEWRKHRKKSREASSAVLTRLEVQRVKKLYPGVEIFESWEEAEAKYPVTERRDLP